MIPSSAPRVRRSELFSAITEMTNKSSFDTHSKERETRQGDRGLHLRASGGARKTNRLLFPDQPWLTSEWPALCSAALDAFSGRSAAEAKEKMQ